MANKQQTVYVIVECDDDSPPGSSDLNNIVGVTTQMPWAEALTVRLFAKRTSSHYYTEKREFTLDDPEIFPEAVVPKGGKRKKKLS